VSAPYPPGERGEFYAALDRHGPDRHYKFFMRPYRRERVVEETLGIVIASWQEAEYCWLRVYIRDTGETLGWKQDGDGVFVAYREDHIDYDAFSDWSRRNSHNGQAFRADRAGGCKRLLKMARALT
jgi:hypothetical protein